MPGVRSPRWRSNGRSWRSPKATSPSRSGSTISSSATAPRRLRGVRSAVHYVGVAFSTGEEFDASWNRGTPFGFKLGKGHVIPGWDAGVQGMKVGGRRKLTIPSAMAYGARGAGGVIAPHEPLVFVVDLLSVD